MKRKIATSIAFAKNFFVTGAIIETSRYVEIEICKHIPTEDNKIIVEFGVGHGNITKEILKRISPSSKLIAFEVNSDFCKYVNETIVDPRLIIINDSALNLRKHIKENIDVVISSIPLSFFSKEKGLSLIQNAYDLMQNHGYFCQVLYTKFNFKKFQRIFEECYLVSNKKNKIEHIFHCKKIE